MTDTPAPHGSELRGERILGGRGVLVIATVAFIVMLVPNIILAVTATRTFSGLVVEDSYIASQDFDRLKAAQLALGWTVRLDHDARVLRLDIVDAAGNVVRPATLAVTMGRPTTTREDRVVAMQETPEGFAGDAPMAPGHWRVEIAATAADGTAFRQSRDVWVDAPAAQP
ncbi:MAG: FixH family protein [Amaricoccus sp.]|uniref:FixH family protein n=1 Tax=Amaricoccus sp. TaxID=1872485 RepID=UPI0039E6EE3E